MKTITKTTTTSLSFSDIADIIDDHFSTETNCLFVTNKNLAEAICDYVLNEYNIMDEDMEINDEILDYYITIYFEDDNINFFCEDARGITGEYKLHYVEDEYVDYYICDINMDVNVVFDKLMGVNGSWNWVSVSLDEDCNNCKYEGTDECCECGDCEECEDEIKEIVCNNNCEECEIPDELCNDIKLIEEYADKIENIECTCGCELRNILYEFLMIGKGIGYEDCKEYIKKFVDEV